MNDRDSRSLTRRTLMLGGAAFGLASAVTGCSNEGRGGSSGDNDEAARSKVRPAYLRYTGVSPDLAGEEFGIPDAFKRYPAEPVDVINDPPGDGKPISVTTYTNAPIPPKLEQNAFWQELNKQVGSPITISLTPSSEYMQKFATAVAGNKLGDIFTVGNIPQIPQLLEARAVDLTPHLSGDNVKKYPFLANLPAAGWNASIFNGKIYGIPIPRGAISSKVLYSREDILEAEGLKAEVKSADDFLELCKALTDSRRNRFALGKAPTEYVWNMFDIPNRWSEDGGSLTSYLVHEGHEQAFELLNRLWKSGYIHPDAFAGQNFDVKARFGNGSSPLALDTFTAWATYLQVAVDKEARIAITSPPKHDGSGPGRIWLGAPTIANTAISKSAEGRVESLLGYLNFLAAPFGTQEYLFRKFGIEGVDYDLVDGNPILNDKGKSETKLGQEYLADSPWAIFLPKEGSSEAAFNAMKEVCPTAIPDPVAGLYSETNVRKGPQIGEAIDNVIDDIIQGRKPISAWAPAVKKWRSDGGDQIAEELAKALADSH
ncbi:extracellular solute-binding protein [Microlunatus sp. GCM10028923]|uniref:extracellular solute-binding protein n=1 Tax=Microlunatus sp. GCM10028923 TaxID=3273400 RepID=UPI003609ED15